MSRRRISHSAVLFTAFLFASRSSLAAFTFLPKSSLSRTTCLIESGFDSRNTACVGQNSTSIANFGPDMCTKDWRVTSTNFVPSYFLSYSPE